MISQLLERIILLNILKKVSLKVGVDENDLEYFKSQQSKLEQETNNNSFNNTKGEIELC